MNSPFSADFTRLIMKRHMISAQRTKSQQRGTLIAVHREQSHNSVAHCNIYSSFSFLNETLTERTKVPETIVEIVEVNGSMPLKHQLGKLLVATMAAFAATKAAEKAYDTILTSYQNRTIKSEV